MGNVNSVKIKPIPIALDKDRTLVYDLNAFAELEEKYGSIDDALGALSKGALSKGSIKTIRTILWVGLIHEDENLTEKQVGAMIGLSDLDRITDAISKGIVEGLPEDAPKNATPGN
jgi:hypothetical protein